MLDYAGPSVTDAAGNPVTATLAVVAGRLQIGQARLEPTRLAREDP